MSTTTEAAGALGRLGRTRVRVSPGVGGARCRVRTSVTGTDPTVPTVRPVLTHHDARSARLSLVPEGALLLAGDRIELDAGDKGRIPERLRHHGRKQPGPDARFEDAAASPAEPFQPLPDRADDEFRREMRILRAAGQRGVVGLADGFLQLFAEVFPPLAESLLAGPGEDGVGEIGGAETGEPDEARLLG